MLKVKSIWQDNDQQNIDINKAQIEQNKQDIQTLRQDQSNLGDNVNAINGEVTSIKENLTHLNQSKQDTLIPGNGIVISDNNISSNITGITPEQAQDIENNKNTISEIKTLTDDLPNTYAKLNNYTQSIKSLEYFVGKDTNYLKANNNNVIVGNDGGGYSGLKNGDNYLYVNRTNAYKRVGSGDEVLASEPWVNNEINNITSYKLLNYSNNGTQQQVDLNLPEETNNVYEILLVGYFTAYLQDTGSWWIPTTNKIIYSNLPDYHLGMLNIVNYDGTSNVYAKINRNTIKAIDSNNVLYFHGSMFYKELKVGR